MTELLRYMDELKLEPPEPPLEPELDDIDEKVDRQLREQMDLRSGSVRKSVIERGHGTDSPAEGDLVFFHLSLKKEDGTILDTTRLDEEGSGVPEAFVLGKGRRAPRGWELALQEMLKGERAVFSISPEYSFAQKGCLVEPPKGVAADAALLIDLQLVNWYKKAVVRAVGELGVIKRTILESESWEHPQAPFEVEVSLTARYPSSSGKQGEGVPFFSSTAPLRWELGSGCVSEHLEEGISAMSKGESAFLSCPLDASAGTGVVPAPPEQVSRVEYEVVLHSMVQVRDLTGTGEVTKRRLKEGSGEFPIDCPLEDNAVCVHFMAYVPGSGQVLYDSRGSSGDAAPLSFDTGVDAVPEAVDMCVRLMTPQEVALVKSAPRFAYDGRADRPADCPEGVEIAFKIELLSFDKTPAWHSMSAADKVTRAEELRQQGNKTFKLGQLRLARHKYQKALKLLDNAYEADTEELMQRLTAAKANCLTNLAFVCQKEESFTECLSWCEKALREDPEHAKALYRRGTTRAILGDYEEAEADLLQAKQADPAAAADIDRELAKMRQRQRLSARKEHEEFKSFFDRTK